MLTTTPHGRAAQAPHLKQPGRRREPVPMRRVNRMHRAAEALEALQDRFPDFADHFQLSIDSLRAEGGRTRQSDTALVVIAIEKSGAWTIEDILLWTNLSRRVVKRILADLVAQGSVKKYKESPRGKGRPRNIYRMTGDGLENKSVLSGQK